MIDNVQWLEAAQDDFRQIANYLLDEWSFVVAEKFTDEIDKCIERIKANPEIGRQTKRLTSIRKIKIKPYHTLHYCRMGKEIWVLNITDDRQENRN
jgi:plasmid stabilization system protein ParE